MTIKTISGGWFPKLSLKPIEPSHRLAWQEAAWLLAAGVLAVSLYSLFHWPMKMPGRHGLEWMAVLIYARSLGRFRWAATVVAFGAAASTQLPIAGIHEPWAALSYLLPGVIVDLFYQSRKDWRHYLLFLAAVSACAHATRPLLHYLETVLFGVHHGSLATGLTYPLLTHLGFGFVGGLTGAVLAALTLRQRR